MTNRATGATLLPHIGVSGLTETYLNKKLRVILFHFLNKIVTTNEI